MTELDGSNDHESSAPRSVDSGALSESLRLAGADQFDPVRLHYLQVLATRANGHQNSVKRLLDAKLAQALVVFKTRFEQAQGECRDIVAQSVPHYPQAAGNLQRLLSTGDFNAVRRLIDTLKSNANRMAAGDLTRSLARQSANKVDAHSTVTTGLRTELHTTQYFRETWSKLTVVKRVTQELHRLSPNAGPINSHRLVLRSLATMRDISPDYLSRFTSYVDTLLCLDQCDKNKQVLTKITDNGDSGKKAKSRRAKAQ